MNIRSHLIQKRKILPKNIQQAAALSVAQKAQALPVFKKSHSIAFYQAKNGEVGCRFLIEQALENQKIVFLPVISAESLKFAPYHPNQRLITNHYGIQEPIATPEKIRHAYDLDLVFVPMVAFDLTMNRIGMGKGYYDKTLHFLKRPVVPQKPFLIGLAYEFQKLEKIDPNAWDIKMNQVITEAHLYP